MNPPMNNGYSAGAGREMDAAETMTEPLFGDQQWIRERMRVLSAQRDMSRKTSQETSSSFSST